MYGICNARSVRRWYLANTRDDGIAIYSKLEYSRTSKVTTDGTARKWSFEQGGPSRRGASNCLKIMPCLSKLSSKVLHKVYTWVFIGISCKNFDFDCRSKVVAIEGGPCNSTGLLFHLEVPL